ncbi:hypothetical protein GCM10028796_26540 [Ramlibacter monticola]|uniref:DedA family protein n=1 Tax=Ramlibacter monticola TaxID=1926872 RepID=A0A937CVG8_9BURK|nr:DedA family protein [Ramlibacter monticola]
MFQQLVIDLLGAQHGAAAYGLLFLLLAVAGIGAPWAQDLVLLAAAGLTLQPGGLHPLAMAASAWAGMLAGDVTSVWAGHHYGARWIRRPWAARFVPPQRLPELEEGMRRQAGLLSFVTRFLPGQRGTLFFLAGALRMPWRPFLAWNGAAAVIQIGFFLYAARTLGWRWEMLRAPFERADDVLTVALVVLLAAWWLRARRAGPR